MTLVSLVQRSDAPKVAAEESRKRVKRQLHPERVLWRFSNHNMPQAWDLDIAHACSGGDVSVEGHVVGNESQFTREGLAVIHECSDWWHKLVRCNLPTLMLSLLLIVSCIRLVSLYCTL
jgi:hypothetical protein